MKFTTYVILVFVLCFCPGKALGGCVKGDCNNGKGSFAYDNGSRYVGEFEDGKMNGKGTLTSADGAKYVGEFRNDMLNGHGI